MPRIRTVKPELFKHEELYEAESETGLPLRLAFIGLFTCCDRDGRFKWRPRALKVEVLPYDDIDFSRVLDALMTRGFVRKYECAGVEYGYIPSFSRHQAINNREHASELPDPSNCAHLDASSTRESRDDHAGKEERKGKEGKGREGKEVVADASPLVPAEPSPVAEQAGMTEVREVFKHWQSVLNHPRATLDAKRTGLIKRALKTHSVADLCLAIAGCSRSEWHMGKNDRAMVYDDLGLILRDASKIEQFMRLAESPVGDPRMSRAQESIRAFAEGDF